MKDSEMKHTKAGDLNTETINKFFSQYDREHGGWCVFQHVQGLATLALRRSNARNTQEKAEALIQIWEQELSEGLIPKYEI